MLYLSTHQIYPYYTFESVKFFKNSPKPHHFDLKYNKLIQYYYRLLHYQGDQVQNFISIFLMPSHDSPMPYHINHSNNKRFQYNLIYLPTIFHRSTNPLALKPTTSKYLFPINLENLPYKNAQQDTLILAFFQFIIYAPIY